jgi:hypothetical protein
MLVQEFLWNGGTLADLEAKYAIGYNISERYPNLVQLKYSQIESPMGEPIVQECRGVILDSANNWRVVARPFDKFFNYGEGHAAKIDWSTAHIHEKCDGSLMILYYYDHKWQVASSGMPDARGQVNGFSFTFAQLFWEVWAELGFDVDCLSPQYTYMFELMTPYNRVIVPHKKNNLVWIGVRNTDFGNEFFPQEDGPFPVAKWFPLQTMDQILESMKHMDPLQQEGYVVVDEQFNRVKLKHPGYVAMAHLRDGMGPKRLLEIVRVGESSEFLVHFPEWANAFNIIKDRFEALVVEMEAAYEQHKTISLRKDFALAIKDVPFKSALFALRDDQIASVRNWLAKSNVEYLVKHLGIREVDIQCVTQSEPLSSQSS